MITGAFDASGHEADQPLLAVAGFISSAKDWCEFSTLWNARLKPTGLAYFHLNELAKWDAKESEKRSLQHDLMQLIRKFAYRKFGMRISTKDFPQSFKDREDWNLRAYTLAGFGCVVYLDEWMSSSSRLPQTSLEYVFEEGDLGQGRLRELIHNSGYPEPLFRPGKKPQSTPSGNVIPQFVPLQAADWLAGEYFLEGQREAGNAPKRVQRWGFQQFQSIPGDIRLAEGPSIEELERKFNLLKHTRYLIDLKP